LPKGYATVGTKVEIKHIAATPIGMEVVAQAELMEIDGLKLKFKVEARDDREKIGEGTHTRYIIKLDDFIKKVESKKNS
jgi:predicted thioesterase